MFVMCYFLFTLLSYKVVSTYSLSNATVSAIPDILGNLTAGNNLWSSLLRNCKNLSLSCIRDNIYEYLKDILDYGDDIQITNFLKFAKNSIDYNTLQTKFEQTLNQTEDTAPLFEDKTPIGDISRSLYDNAVKFLMSHNLEVQLPDFFFPETILKLSPRTFEEDGALVKLEILPKVEKQSVGEGRIFFKKIRKFISQRLIYALLAILLVIKLLAVKILFVLPTIVGVATAKKLLIKVLLFLFPALHHLFKLCAYVPYGAKHHIHKHQVAHIHEISHGHHHHGSHPKSHNHEDVIVPHIEGPYSHHYSNVNKDNYETYEGLDSLYPTEPYFANGILDHRNDPILQENEIGSWDPVPTIRRNKHAVNERPLTPTAIENMVLMAEKEALIKARLQKEKQRIRGENLRLQEQLNKALVIQEKLRQKTAVAIKGNHVAKPNRHNKPSVSHALHSSFAGTPYVTNVVTMNTLQAHKLSDQFNSPQILLHKPIKIKEEASIAQQQSQSKSSHYNKQDTGIESEQIKQSNFFDHDVHKTISVSYDAFYDPILDKMDKIFTVLGFSEEACRERLICSMYKNPPKFSPHSNLLSAELSRDSNDLQKPTSTNTAVIRFYRYVQAARDGQDKRDCIRLYPACQIDTEL